MTVEIATVVCGRRCVMAFGGKCGSWVGTSGAARARFRVITELMCYVSHSEGVDQHAVYNVHCQIVYEQEFWQ